MILHLKTRRAQGGFTLVEILAVLVILSLMSGMVLTAVQGVTTTAKAARTRSIIETVNSVIQEQYDSYKYRPFSVEPPNFDQLAPSGDTFGYELLAGEAARVRMLLIRDLQRMEMPDRLSDIADAPTVISAAANPVVKDTTDHDNDGDRNETIGVRDDNSRRKSFQTTGYDSNATYAVGGYNIPRQLSACRNRIPSKKLDGTDFNLDYSTPEEAQNQGAECLYLILATTFSGGQPAISSIPASNIGDTDGDNLLEILDGWGQPLGFVRWPVGYVDTDRSIDATKPDEFDLFRSDFSYVNNTTDDANAIDINFKPPVDSDLKHPEFRTAPWSVRPLIVSAGPDGEFGIALNPWTDKDNDASEVIDFSYRANALWPVNVARMGDESGGRSAPYMMIDPFLRNFVGTATYPYGGLLPGQDIPGQRDARADDITNYGLQSEQ